MDGLLLRLQRSLSRYLHQIDHENSNFDDKGGTFKGCCVISSDALPRQCLVVLQEIADRYPGASIAAYGSQINGKADVFSDLDVILIDGKRYAHPVHERLSIHGMSVDLTKGDAAALSKVLSARHKHNNNWLLHGLSHCFVYSDVTSEMSSLIRQADRLINAGPQPFSSKEIEGSLRELEQRLRSAQLLCRRSHISQNNSLVARIRSDQLVSQAIYLYFCMRNKWTTSFPRLLDKCEQDFPELYVLWDRYAHQSDMRNAIVTARDIAAMVPQRCIEVSTTDCLGTESIRRTLYVG